MNHSHCGMNLDLSFINEDNYTEIKFITYLYAKFVTKKITDFFHHKIQDGRPLR